MGVLVHPNYSDELANGVAVSFDPYYGRDGRYYVNTQVGEDLVTNPEAHSVPEEIFLHRDLNLSTYQVVATSNQVPRGELLMSDDQLDQLRRHLIVIHDHFERLYDPPSGEPFAMEIEFKITEDNILAIKQARPWVFSRASPQEPPPPPPPPPPSRDAAWAVAGHGGTLSPPFAPDTASYAASVAPRRRRGAGGRRRRADDRDDRLAGRQRHRRSSIISPPAKPASRWRWRSRRPSQPLTVGTPGTAARRRPRRVTVGAGETFG